MGTSDNQVATLLSHTSNTVRTTHDDTHDDDDVALVYDHHVSCRGVPNNGWS